MKKATSVFTMVGTAAMLAGMSVPAVSYADVSVCYETDEFIDVLRLNIKKHSTLARDRFGPVQVAYSANGKDVEFDNVYETDGTVVVGNGPLSSASPRGARMGLHMQIVAGDGFFGGNEFAFPVTLNCASTEVRPDPSTWRCQGKNDGPLYLGSFELHKVSPSSNPGCTTFQDGSQLNRPLNLRPGQKAFTSGD